MKLTPRLSTIAAVVAGSAALLAASASSALLFDQNVTPNAIFGNGVTNGSFTVDQRNGVEIGLRGKLRHNASGAAENTYNSNGDGTYSFAAGVAPTQPSPTAVWSFEWSINVDYTDTSNSPSPQLNDFTYRLGLDTDVTSGTNFSVVFDPINAIEPIAGSVCWDHSMGVNGTAQSGGIEIAGCRDANAAVAAAAVVQYDTILATHNVAQNSWKAHWYFGPTFNPTVDATYDIYLAAIDPRTGDEVARSSIQIIVGAGGADVPAPATLALLAAGLFGLGVARRRSKKF